MSTRRLSPGHGCGLCGLRDWGYDEYLGRWKCLNCASKGEPIPPTPDFAEVFDFDNWYHAVQSTFDETARRLGQLEREPEPNGEAQKLVRKAELKRLHRDYDTEFDLSTLAMSLRMIRELAISEKADFYVHIPTCNVQIRFNGSPADSTAGHNT